MRHSAIATSAEPYSGTRSGLVPCPKAPDECRKRRARLWQSGAFGGGTPACGANATAYVSASASVRRMPYARSACSRKAAALTGEELLSSPRTEASGACVGAAGWHCGPAPSSPPSAPRLPRASGARARISARLSAAGIAALVKTSARLKGTLTNFPSSPRHSTASFSWNSVCLPAWLLASARTMAPAACAFLGAPASTRMRDHFSSSSSSSETHAPEGGSPGV
mmetsp:Transcript_14511/g.38504  ORF Transcript_14511/g.38504 Transcript_14511/m.38504 type:complete len:224 (-) Transcript_14511:390-1061(-)